MSLSRVARSLACKNFKAQRSRREKNRAPMQMILMMPKRIGIQPTGLPTCRCCSAAAWLLILNQNLPLKPPRVNHQHSGGNKTPPTSLNLNQHWHYKYQDNNNNNNGATLNKSGSPLAAGKISANIIPPRVQVAASRPAGQWRKRICVELAGEQYASCIMYNCMLHFNVRCCSSAELEHRAPAIRAILVAWTK